MSQIKIFYAKRIETSYDITGLEKEVNGWLIAHNDDIEEVVKMYSTELAGKPVFWIWYE